MYKKQTVTQGSISVFSQETDLQLWAEAFLVDRKAQNFSAGTLYFYQKKLKLFLDYCDAQAISQITQITPNNLRSYLLYLEQAGHNSGGIHCCYRAIKTFLRWWENEVELEDWTNPIRKVKAPRVALAQLEPVELSDVSDMVKCCQSGTFTGERDKAIMLTLLDTGARAQEFLDTNLDDINLISGEILISHGKWGKPRTVFVGRACRKAIRRYLKHRVDDNQALWVTDDGQRLYYDGLRSIITRRARQADIKPPSLHSFRRAFAINMLRAGVNIYSLQALMGHAGLTVLQRYLKMTDNDIAQAHRLGSPVDNMKLSKIIE